MSCQLLLSYLGRGMVSRRPATYNSPISFQSRHIYRGIVGSTIAIVDLSSGNGFIPGYSQR